MGSLELWSVSLNRPAVPLNAENPDELVDQIEHREQEDPDDVDDVPVEADTLDGVVVAGTELAAASTDVEPDEERHPDQHVTGVDAGCAPVKAPPVRLIGAL